MNGEISLMINSELDIVSAREKGRWLATQIGFRASEVTLLSTLVSELARKVVSLECGGSVLLQSVQRGTRKGITISVTQNPLNTRFDSEVSTTSGQVKVSLPYDDRLLLLAGRHVADEFEIRPIAPKGATVKVVKWL